METGAKAENWAEDPDVIEEANKFYPLIVQQFENQSEQSDRIEEYFNIYNAQPDENLQYTGNSQSYVPAVRDCINARAKRTLKQLFPVNHRHVDGVTTDGKVPYTQLSLLEHYIRTTNLKTIVRTDLVSGDVTGQWNLMVEWSKSKRKVTSLVKKPPVIQQIDGEDVKDLGLIDVASEDEEGTEEKEIIEEGPEVIEFATEDLAVIPPTCNDLQKAKCVALRLRMSKEAVQEYVDDGVFILPDGADIDDLFNQTGKLKSKRDRAKKQTEDAGIKTNGTYKHLLVFMAYGKLDLGGESKESAIMYFAGPDMPLGIIRNPLWSKKIPILSKPVERVAGSFFGKSKIEPVKFMQWNLCDFFNMGQDSAMYSLLPVFAVDPLKTPQWANMTMGLAAVWPVAPADVKPLQFPQLWKDSAGICEFIEKRIWAAMDVNEMMMGKTPSGRKNNAMIGNMQQEQATNISDNAEAYEEVMLTPLVELLFEFDQQFRTDDVMIEQRGEIGVKAAIEVIPPQEWDERYFFRWSGTAYQLNMSRMQQQIAWVNVMKGIPPQMMGGKTLDLSPMLEAGTENMFGPELAPLILKDERNMYTVPPTVENEIMHNGMPVDVHDADNDTEHLQSHMQAASANSDPQGIYKTHMGAHMMSMQKKREKMQAQQGGLPGMPGGAGPGVAGAPRPGAQPMPGRPGQQPPGAVQQDNMEGAPGRG